MAKNKTSPAALKARINAERVRFGCRPWEVAPSEIDPRHEPYADSPGCAGSIAWYQAMQWRKEILAVDPRYFDE